MHRAVDRCAETHLIKKGPSLACTPRWLHSAACSGHTPACTMSCSEWHAAGRRPHASQGVTTEAERTEEGCAGDHKHLRDHRCGATSLFYEEAAAGATSTPMADACNDEFNAREAGARSPRGSPAASVQRGLLALGEPLAARLTLSLTLSLSLALTLMLSRPPLAMSLEP